MVRCAWLLLACLVGCSPIPIMVPDMDRYPAQRVSMEGANGPLSPARTQAILQRLQQQGSGAGIFERHLAVEEAIAGTPLLVGNKVTLLRDGPATFKAMFTAIQEARDHINVEFYIIEDDEVGNRFADALIAKRAEGVDVNLIFDSVGGINTPSAFFDRLKAGGVRVLEFNPINPLTARRGWEVNWRDHRKVLIVDGRTAFVGGINISSVYSRGSFSKRQRPKAESKLPWRDTHVQLEGPVVAEFQRMFVDTWQKQGGELLTDKRYFPPPATKGPDVARAVGGTPEDSPNPIYVTMLSAIRSAETSVHLTNAYFVPDKQMIAALTEAAARGVDVKIILPSTTDSGLVFHAGRSYYTALLRGGVKIYEQKDAVLHAKTAVVDGVWSTVGSTNLDWRSFVHNNEINAVILGGAFGAQMEAMFEADLARSDRITLERWQQRSLATRMKETGARLWEYWL